MKNKRAADHREPIELEITGSVAKQIVLGVTQATSQTLQSAGGLVAAFLEGKGYLKPEEWRVHVTGMEFDESAQSLRITGLRLVPVESA
jgi:uncharacterized protein YjeT (DUF2065 family)